MTKPSMDTLGLAAHVGTEEAIRILYRAGFRTFDLAYYELGPEQEEIWLGDNYLENAKKLRAMCDELGMTCHQMHGPIIRKPETSLYHANPVDIHKALECAAIMGAGVCVVHFPQDKFRDYREVEDFDTVVAFYRQFEETAKRVGVKIGVENLIAHDADRDVHTGGYGDPHKMEKLLDTLGENYTLCFDTGHCAVTNGSVEDVIDGYKKGRIRYLHVQDTDYLQDWHTLPYLLSHRWDKILQALKNNGYQGTINLEVFNYFRKMPDELLQPAADFAYQIAKHLCEEYDKL